MMTREELIAYNRNRRICQICFLDYEENLEKTLRNWVEKLGIGPWKVFKRKPMIEGREGMIIALAMIGSLEMEIVCPTGPRGHLRDWLDKHGPGFNHMKEYVSEPEMESVIKTFADRGVELCSLKNFNGKLPPRDPSWPDIARFFDTEEYVTFRLEIGNFAHLGDEALKNSEMYYWYPAE